MEGLGTPEKRLYDAAATGDTGLLNDLITKDPLLLDRVSFTCPNKPPLHVAIMRGHVDFVDEILKVNPHLAKQLDFQQTSPLHIASSEGYLDIVKILISVAPGMCLSRDFQGRNPLHLAAIEGHVEVLAELVQRDPLAATEKAYRGQTALHLCAKHRHLEALKILVQSLDRIIDARDDDGDTVLHIAVRGNQIEIAQYLVENTFIDVMAENSMGQSALVISTKNPVLTKILNEQFGQSNESQSRALKWLTKKRESLMLVATLMATMAFQAGVTPPGGVWQEDLTHDQQGNPLPIPRRAGDAVISYRSGGAFQNFVRFNSAAFILSLSTILLLISGIPFRNKLCMCALITIVGLTVWFTAITYSIAITVVSPGNIIEYRTKFAVVIWFVLIGFLFFENTIQLIFRWFEKRRWRDYVEARRWLQRFMEDRNNENESVA